MLYPVGALLGLFQGDFDPVTFLILILVLCISLSFHEMAHAWAAWRLGDDTAALAGRLTMNPLAHLDPIGAIAFLIGGIGWARPVPINPARFHRRISIKKGLMLTSLAGPSANLLLSTVSLILLFVINPALKTLGSQASQLTVAEQIMLYFYGYNVILAGFNLLPVPPLDGFKIFGSVLPDRVYFRLMSYERYIGIVFLILVLLTRNYLRIITTLIFYLPELVIFPWLREMIGLI